MSISNQIPPRIARFGDTFMCWYNVRKWCVSKSTKLQFLPFIMFIALILWASTPRNIHICRSAGEIYCIEVVILKTKSRNEMEVSVSQFTIGNKVVCWVCLMAVGCYESVGRAICLISIWKENEFGGNLFINGIFNHDSAVFAYK